MCIGDFSHQITGRKPLKGGFIMAQGLRSMVAGRTWLPEAKEAYS